MFLNRKDAGRRLADRLGDWRGQDIVVLGLPRGGVPVAFEVARRLGAPLDVILVRKLGVPWQPELGMGAIGEGGVRVVHQGVLDTVGVSSDDLTAVEELERAELSRRARQFRGDHPAVDIADRVALIVDDGVATGSTARAACRVARARGAARVVLAVPVASAEAARAFQVGDEVDELVCLEAPEAFGGVGQFYEDFSQTSDEEVVEFLDRARDLGEGGNVLPRDAAIEVDAGELWLPGHLTVPPNPVGTVIFAHGSGSGRHSPRNRFVARDLNQAGLATLLFDLLTVEEAENRANVFDIELLADRLLGAARWLTSNAIAGGGPVGFFGASTGAGAALWAAADPEAEVAAVVSRGGRPDLADDRLAEVRAPTLLIVGGADEVVLRMNESAQAKLRNENDLVIVPGATHLFEEEGALEAVSEAARDWFVTHFTAAD
ncbi:putative phosphoribosyl transferase [Stackebrandtia endophytica]|uniref:Putative phosphoribosyl transferase n=1 Tax=Stackebrandtia endophytica TaxID=1496996 RepID=A0A543ASP8_9ACTN|nr:alpha/beta family hydrolase [Stackebrandtia endophytica]TQL75609.1 putative phosphoribosyl transferase [Stackebrandtia endophytica]